MDERQLQEDAQHASNGDTEALQRLIVHCHETLYRVVAKARSAALAYRVDPDDILQQAYVVAFKTLCSSPESSGTATDGSSATKPGPKARSTGRLPRFKNTGHFYKWLEAVALNQLRDTERVLRRHKRDAAREVKQPGQTTGSYPSLVQQLAGDDPTPSRSLARVEAVAAVMSSLARLPDNQRKVIRWRFVQGVSFAEIAQRLGKSEDATYMICHRGLKALRGMLVSITHFLTKL